MTRESGYSTEREVESEFCIVVAETKSYSNAILSSDPGATDLIISPRARGDPLPSLVDEESTEETTDLQHAVRSLIRVALTASSDN